MATVTRWTAAAVLVWMVGCGGCSIALPPGDEQTVGESSPAEHRPNSPPGEVAPPKPEIAEPTLEDQPDGQGSPTSDPWGATPVAAVQPVGAPAAAALPAESPAEVLDLLALVDLQRDSVTGSWSREGTSLVTPAEPRSVLAISRTPPENYRWTVVLERLSGHESLNLCLTVGGQQTMVVLEGFGSYCRGLNLVDGRPANQNATTTRGRVFQAGTPCTVVCTVRRSGPVDYAVQVVCDGQTIIRWTGNPSRLALDRRFWAQIPGDRLAIAIYDGPNARFRISRMELEPLEPSPGSGARAPLAQSPPPSPPQRGAGPPFPPPGSLARRPARPDHSGTGAGSETDPGPGTRAGPAAEPPEAAARRKESVALIDHPLGAGTGFVVGQNLLATNAHVVGGSFVDDLDVHFTDDDRRYRAKRVVYVNDVCDLALLEVSGMEREAVPLAADLSFQRGQAVVIIGNPSVAGAGVMVRNAVTQGTVTALMRIRSYDFYQIEAAVNPGSSGGPVLNLDGELIAVVAMKATDRGADEIRAALKQLDDTFRAHFDPSGRKGVAFGVPAGALSQAIQQVETQSEDQANRVHGQQLAKSLLRRMATLGAIHILEMQVNISPEFRQQALQARKTSAARRIPGPQPKFADLIPQDLADGLRRQLNGQEVRTLMRVCSAELDERLDRLRNSGYADEAVVESLASLLRTLKTAKRSAETPPTTYQAYSKTVLGLSDDLKRLIERLEGQLAVARSALDD